VDAVNKINPEELKPNQEALLLELMALRHDPIGYGRRKKEVAKILIVPEKDVEKAVRLLEKAASAGTTGKEPTQSQLAVHLVLTKAELWRDPEKNGYAAVKVGDHIENYRLSHNAFRRWVRAEYGKAHTSMMPDGTLIACVLNGGALKEAIEQLEGMAALLSADKEFELCVRVGVEGSAVYLDLGRDDWGAVEITAEGWRIVPRAKVAFIRPQGKLPLFDRRE
jgi:hypothetical protein